VAAVATPRARAHGAHPVADLAVAVLLVGDADAAEQLVADRVGDREVAAAALEGRQ
jgi:hypothetical protein